MVGLRQNKSERNKMKKFENKTVLVTGGTSGIGLAIVKGFLEEGANVAFTDITDRGVAQSEDYNKQGFKTMFIQADATKDEEVAESLESVISHFGILDIAINNVGGQASADIPFTQFHESSVEGWHDTQNITEQSTYLYMRHEIAQMIKQGGGVIANTVSMGGLKAQPGATTPSYAVSKAAVIHLTKYTALQYAKQNIRINAVAPGLVATEKMKQTLTPEQREEIVQQAHPNGILIEPAEIANAFLYLCSDEARSITGVILPVDGGLSAS